MDRAPHLPFALLLASLALTLGVGCGEDVPLGTLPGPGDAGARDGGMDGGRDAGFDGGRPDAGYDAGPPRPVGAACEGDSQCAGPGALCLRATVELIAGLLRVDFSNGGYCTRECDDMRMCPTGSVCTPDTVSLRYCVAVCTGDPDCRTAEGYTCQDVSGTMVCVPPAI